MPGTLLLVEDDADSADALSTYLELEGYRVRWARSGGEALQSLVDQTDGGAPAMVLLDLTLPDMSGVEAGRKIRCVCRAPIVILSARQPEAIRDAAATIGAIEVLRKPFDLAALVGVIERTLAKGP